MQPLQNQFESRHLRTFNLVRPPFTQSVEDDVFFQIPQQTQFIDQLKHLGRFSNLILIISGEKGSGKTTLIQQYLNASNTQHLHALIQGKFSLEKTDLLSQLLHAYNCEHEISDYDAMYAALIEHLKIYTRKVTTPLLIIDDAHLLAENCWELLKNLSHLEPHNGQCLIHLFIFTNPDGANAFISPELKTRVKMLKLRGMNKQSCKNYLQYRFVTIGQASNSLFQLIFTPTVISNIYRKSRGCPRQINLLAQQRLDVYVARDIPSNTEQKIRYFSIKQITIALCGVIVLGSILLYQNDINQFVNLVESTKLEDDKNTDTDDEDPTTPLLSPIQLQVQTNQDTSVLDPKPELMPTREIELDLDVKTGGPTVIPEQQDPEEAFSSTEHSGESLEQQMQPESANSMVDPQKNELISIDDFFARFPQIKDEKWLTQQTGDFFTIQIIGTNNIAVLEQFMVNHSKLKDLAYYSSIRKEETWHNIVTGIYNDMPEVRQAISKLPRSIKRNIWIRRIRGIKADAQRSLGQNSQ